MSVQWEGVARVAQITLLAKGFPEPAADFGYIADVYRKLLDGDENQNKELFEAAVVRTKCLLEAIWMYQETGVDNIARAVTVWRQNRFGLS